MHEDLIGYLLGAIDVDQRRRIEQALATDPALRRELDRLRQAMQPLEALNDTHAAPVDLIDRTLERIAQYDSSSERRAQAPSATPAASGSLFVRSWAPADCLVMGLIVLAAFSLLFPALVNSRFEARKVICQDKLRMLGIQLITYSNRRADHGFPFVPLSGKRAFAGIFAPTLHDNMLLSRHSDWLICPGSELAAQRSGWYVPSLDDVDQATDQELVLLRRQAAGSYAYSIGYFGADGYRANRNLGRTHFALVGDTPSTYLPGRISANHAGRGQNICFEDGHVEFVRDPHVMRSDDPLRNRLGYAEAGIDRDDAVVLPSAMRPVVGKPPIPRPTAGSPLQHDPLQRLMPSDRHHD